MPKLLEESWFQAPLEGPIVEVGALGLVAVTGVVKVVVADQGKAYLLHPAVVGS